MAEINLLKNELRGPSMLSLGEAKTPLLLVVIGLLVAELLVYGGLFWYGKQLDKRAVDIQTQQAAVDAQLNAVDQARLTGISYQSRLRNLSVLLDQHLFWSALFGEIESFTYKPVTFDNLQITPGDNKVLLSGTVPSYSDLGKLILGLKQSPKILDVQLMSSGQKQSVKSGYGFSLEITFDPKILLK